ncbi:Flap-structured DNA-binding and RNA-binding protein, partial [Teratosphaeriaceae sp. CCFEE 6253]
MFPDAANAIEDQKAEFQKTTGTAPKSNRNSMADRLSTFAPPSISAPQDDDVVQQQQSQHKK